MLNTKHVIEEFIVLPFTFVCVVTSQLSSTNRIFQATNRSWYAEFLFLQTTLSTHNDDVNANAFVWSSVDRGHHWERQLHLRFDFIYCKCMQKFNRPIRIVGAMQNLRFAENADGNNIPYLSSLPELHFMFHLWFVQFYWSTICQFASKTTKL